MTEIIVNKGCKLSNVIGHHVSKNSKAVVDSVKGTVWVSGVDCSNELDVSPSSVSNCCNKIIKTCKGRKLYRANDEYIVSILAERVRELNECEWKAKLYDEIQPQLSEIETVKNELAKANDELSTFRAYKDQKRKVAKLKQQVADIHREYLKELEALEAMQEAL